MRKSTIDKWLKENFESLKNEYCLETWTIKVTVENSDPDDKKSSDETALMLSMLQKLPGRTQAYVTKVLYSYEVADMYVFYTNIRNIKELEDVIRHELWHCVLGGYYEAKEVWAEELSKKHRTAYNTIMGHLNLVDELTVRHLEKIYLRKRDK